MASVETNGITIEYEVAGHGDPLVLIMGLGGQLVDWPDGLVDQLVGEGFRVIRLDNRDSGLSTAIDASTPTVGELAKQAILHRGDCAAYRLDDLADDTAGLLESLGVERAHVAGFSMGGMIAQALAIRHPDRVSSLTSMGSTTGNPKVGRPAPRIVRIVLKRRHHPTREGAVDSAVELFERISGPTFEPAEFRALAEASVERSFRPDGTTRQLACILCSPDRTEALGHVSVPTLVVHGMLDPLVRPSGGVATAKAVPGARLVMFNDMGHDLPRTRWAEIAHEIRTNADRASAFDAVAAAS
jgi:pimeloyl-ACP methyl ester carboxylesterase